MKKKTKQSKTRRKNSKKEWNGRVLQFPVAPDDPKQGHPSIRLPPDKPTLRRRCNLLHQWEKGQMPPDDPTLPRIERRSIDRRITQRRCQTCWSETFSTGCSVEAPEQCVGAITSADSWRILQHWMIRRRPDEMTPSHRFIRCQLDAPVPMYRIIRCHCELQNSSISTFLWVLSSCFSLLGLFASSLGSINVHLTNLLVPLIALLLNY